MAHLGVNALAGLFASVLVAQCTSPPNLIDSTDKRTSESLFLRAATAISAPMSYLAFVAPNLVQLALAYDQIKGGLGWVPRSAGDLTGLSGWEWTGIALQAVGAVLRLWCFRVLGRFFTFQVTIRKEHKLVRDPPYSHIRHPSYTGITMVGFGTLLRAFGQHSALVQLGYAPTWMRTPAAFALAGIIHGIVLAERIRGEERSLKEAFPKDYPDYERSTWRLVPYLL